MFYSTLVYTVASIDTQCIDSNLESGPGRYISREFGAKLAGGASEERQFGDYQNKTVESLSLPKIQ